MGLARRGRRDIMKSASMPRVRDIQWIPMEHGQ